MARYTGPKHRLARREGINILDKTSQSLQRRLNIPPGVHGKKRKRALSEFGRQLREKQKAKAMYGVLEKQFSRIVDKAQKLSKSSSPQKKEAGDLLIALLETRLDNIVYRLGFAKTRFQARQFVTHGHVVVNNKKVTIPSYTVKENDTISLSDKLKKNPEVLSFLSEKPQLLLYLSRTDLSGKLLRLPKALDVEVPFDTRLIIEYYSR